MSSSTSDFLVNPTWPQNCEMLLGEDIVFGLYDSGMKLPFLFKSAITKLEISPHESLIRITLRPTCSDDYPSGIRQLIDWLGHSEGAMIERLVGNEHGWVSAYWQAPYRDMVFTMYRAGVVLCGIGVLTHAVWTPNWSIDNLVGVDSISITCYEPIVQVRSGDQDES